MNSIPNIYLIGPMGTGKSTIGKQLASHLRMEFLDSDRVIEERTGVDIPLIFEKEGEEGFRKREANVIEELADREGVVIATGGGVILDAENRSRLRNSGTVFYLKSSIEDLVKRTSKDKRRPLLQGVDDPGKVIADILAQREPLYKDTADYIIDTSNSNVTKVIQQIKGHLRRASIDQ